MLHGDMRAGLCMCLGWIPIRAHACQASTQRTAQPTHTRASASRDTAPYRSNQSIFAMGPRHGLQARVYTLARLVARRRLHGLQARVYTLARP